MGDAAGDVAVVALLALGPVLLVVLTSFVKISVVLALLRNGLGTPDAPSGLVVTGVSLLLTLFVMAPVVDDVVDAVAPPPATAPTPAPAPGPAPDVPGPAPAPGAPAPAPGPLPAPAPASGAAATAEPGLAERAWPDDAAGWLAAADRGVEPLRAFLARHAHGDDRAMFAALASRLRDGAPVADDDLAVLAPAFVTSELAEAFAIGFLLLLPFLVIDLVVGLALASLGLAGTSPAAVALPFKLLLFVAVDGWRLLVEGLVLGYAP